MRFPRGLINAKTLQEGQRPPDAGSGVQGVDQLISFVRDGLHLGLGGRIGNRQAQRRQREELARKVLIGGGHKESACELTGDASREEIGAPVETRLAKGIINAVSEDADAASGWCPLDAGRKTPIG
jgi:hypothetical protein